MKSTRDTCGIIHHFFGVQKLSHRPTPTPTPSAPPTARAFRISTDSAIQGQPAISGDYVVWADHRHGNIDIYAYNLTTEQETPITTDEENDMFPLIDGDLGVWARTPTLCPYGYDLLVGEEFPIVTEDGWQGDPRIWGNTVVWTDNRDEGNQDIYGATLEY